MLWPVIWLVDAMAVSRLELHGGMRVLAATFSSESDNLGSLQDSLGVYFGPVLRVQHQASALCVAHLGHFS